MTLLFTVALLAGGVGVKVAPSRDAAAGRDRAVAALERALRRDDGPAGGIETRLEDLRREIGKRLRLRVGERRFPPGRISVCDALGSCPENAGRDGRGGPLCCSSVFADDSIWILRPRRRR